MADDVDVDLDDLDLVVARLKSFQVEFESLGDTTRGVSDAAGAPQGRTELKDKLTDFESGWDGNREVLCEDLGTVYQHLKDIADGLRKTDVELAKGN